MLNAIFMPGQTDINVNGLHQWDYGQKIQIVSDDLPAVIEVHFACVGMQDAIVRCCSVINGRAIVSVPDACLEQSTTITAWIFEINDTEGATAKTITLPIMSRARYDTSKEVPEEIIDKYTEALTVFNELIEAFKAGTIVVGRAREADTATGAFRASVATTADTATRAIDADAATRAIEADTARHATTAESAESADFATKSESADFATFADDTEKVAGLEVSIDAKGVIEIGGKVVPRKTARVETQCTVTEESTVIFSDTKSLSGRTFEIVDGLGSTYKFVVDPTNLLTQQLSWMGGIRDVNLDNQIILKVNHGQPKILFASCANEGDSFTVERMYEIIE